MLRKTISCLRWCHPTFLVQVALPDGCQNFDGCHRGSMLAPTCRAPSEMPCHCQERHLCRGLTAWRSERGLMRLTTTVRQQTKGSQFRFLAQLDSQLLTRRAESEANL